MCVRTRFGGFIEVHLAGDEAPVDPGGMLWVTGYN